MAIVFQKDISTTKLLMAYNNHIIIFNASDLQAPINCEITGLGINAVIYPAPNGYFYFNLLEYIKKAINTNNFVETVVPALNGADVSTFTYDVTNGCYLNDTLTLKINLEESISVTATRNLKFLAGVENLETWKKNEILMADADYIILSPVKDRSNNKVYLKYWEGYPFEFSFYTNFPTAEFTLINTTNGLSYGFDGKGRITSLYLSDGRTDETIENFLPLVYGTNVLRISKDDVLQDPIIYLNKAEADCGIYIKWLNKYGRWNYWLFNKNHFRNRNSRYESELANDFSNLDETISPTLQTGKNTTDTLKCIYERLNAEEKLVLEGITESIKILMFTGERYSQAEPNDWIEVTLKSTSFPMVKPKTEIYNMEVEFELPTRYGIKL